MGSVGVAHQHDDPPVCIHVAVHRAAEQVGDEARVGPPGRIVNMSSVAGRFAKPFMGAYNASKFGLEGLSDALRRELIVYGVDVVLIQPGMIALLERRIASERLTNMTTVLGSPDDPKLPANSIDLAIMVDVYHELQDPQAFLQRLKPAFKPGGRLALLEFRKEDPKIPILEVHKMSVAEVKQEMEAEGYAIDRVIEGLPWQHLILIKVADAK